MTLVKKPDNKGIKTAQKKDRFFQFFIAKILRIFVLMVVEKGLRREVFLLSSTFLLPRAMLELNMGL